MTPEELQPWPELPAFAPAELEPLELPPRASLDEAHYAQMRKAYRPRKGKRTHATGRKAPSLDSPQVQHLLAALEAGNFVQTAAASAGLSERSVYRWLERGRAEDAAGTRGEYWQLWQAIETARAIAQARALETVMAAAERGTWKAAAWWLERAHPREWGRQSRGIDADFPQASPSTEELEAAVTRILASLDAD